MGGCVSFPASHNTGAPWNSYHQDVALTTFQERVLKSMQTMPPPQQQSVAEFAASLAKKCLKKKILEDTQVCFPGRSSKTKFVPAHLQSRQPKPSAKSAKSPARGILPLERPKSTPQRTDRSSPSQGKTGSRPPNESLVPAKPAKRNQADIEEVVSQKRRKEPSPPRSGPSGQKWAFSRWSKAGH